MTKFLTIDKKSKKEKKSTVFTAMIDDSLICEDTNDSPTEYDYVLFIGSCDSYGDVFKAWNDGAEDVFTIFFGEKGDEFD